MSVIARRWGLVVSVLLLLIAIVLIAADGDGGGRVADGVPRLVTADELGEIAESVNHDVYWAGERPPSQMEVTEEPDGNIFLRYLPAEAEVGDPGSAFLTVGTYPVGDAVGALEDAAEEEGVDLERIGEAFVLASSASEGSAYLAEPGSDLQIEVYDPRPDLALELIRAGVIRPVD